MAARSSATEQLSPSCADRSKQKEASGPNVRRSARWWPKFSWWRPLSSSKLGHAPIRQQAESVLLSVFVYESMAWSAALSQRRSIGLPPSRFAISGPRARINIVERCLAWAPSSEVRPAIKKASLFPFFKIVSCGLCTGAYGENPDCPFWAISPRNTVTPALTTAEIARLIWVTPG